MSGLDGPVGRVEQFVLHRVHVDRLPQQYPERRDGCFGVIAGTVEAPVHQPLHPYP